MSDSDDSSSDESKAKFASAIDPAFSSCFSSSTSSKAKPIPKLNKTESGDKYADQRVHLSKKLSKYLEG